MACTNRHALNEDDGEAEREVESAWGTAKRTVVTLLFGEIMLCDCVIHAQTGNPSTKGVVQASDADILLTKFNALFDRKKLIKF